MAFFAPLAGVFAISVIGLTLSGLLCIIYPPIGVELWQEAIKAISAASIDPAIAIGATVGALGVLALVALAAYVGRRCHLEKKLRDTTAPLSNLKEAILSRRSLSKTTTSTDAAKVE